MKMAEMISMPQLIDGWSSLSGLNAAMKWWRPNSGTSNAENWKKKSEIRNQKLKIWNQRSEIRNQKSEIRLMDGHRYLVWMQLWSDEDQIAGRVMLDIEKKSEIRNQILEIRNQKSETRYQKQELMDGHRYLVWMQLWSDKDQIAGRVMLKIEKKNQKLEIRN